MRGRGGHKQTYMGHKEDTFSEGWDTRGRCWYQVQSLVKQGPRFESTKDVNEVSQEAVTLALAL